MFLETETSPENLKRNGKDPKKKPNTSKNSNKKIQIWPQKQTIFRSLFRLFWTPNWFPKLHQNRSQLLSFFLLLYFTFSQTHNFHTIKVPFWNTIWTNYFAHNPNKNTRHTKISSREPSEASKKQTNAFIKPEKTQGFSRFCDHGLPMRPTKDPRATQKTPKDLQHPCKNKPKKNR